MNIFYKVGNSLLSDGANTYTYDLANHLTAFNDGTNTYTYAYNGLGHRLQQTVNYTTTTYAVDMAGGLTQVLSDGTNTYLYGVDRINQQHDATTEYYLADALGSVRQLTDSNGDVVLARAYDPYGNLMESNAYTGVTTAYGYTGEYTDTSGMVYLRARYYSPAQGRFVSRDVWEGDYYKPLSYNSWIYTYQNPINYIDPSGYQSCHTPGECAELTLKYTYYIDLGSEDGLAGFSDEEKSIILNVVTDFANLLGTTSTFVNNLSLTDINMAWGNDSGDWNASYNSNLKKIKLPPGWYSPVIAQAPNGMIYIILYNPCIEKMLDFPDDSLPTDKIEAQFVLAHEIGHALQFGNKNTFQSFKDNVDLPLSCFAIFNPNPLIKRNAMRNIDSEVFADMMAAYLYSPSLLNQQMRDWIQTKMHDTLI